MRKILVLAAAAFLLLPLNACKTYPRQTLKDKSEAIITLKRNKRIHLHYPELRKLADSISREELLPTRLRSYDTRTLEVLFHALDIAEAELHRPDLLEAMEMILQETLKNRQTYLDFPEILFTKYIGQRNWEKARSLSELFPEREAFVLPNIKEDKTISGPAVYEISPDGESLLLRSIDISRTPLIVSVTPIHCHFSRNAVQYIESNPDIMRAFTNYAVNIDNSQHSLPVKSIARLNKNGKFKYTLIHKPEAWPSWADFDRSPRFYFLKDGKVVYTVKGWESDLNGEKLKQGIQLITQ